MLKRFYHLLALLAMINLFAVVGLVTYLFTSGRLNAQRVGQIAVVLRGEFPSSQPAVAATQPARQEENPQGAGEELVRQHDQKELIELTRSRREREIRDRDVLDQRIQLEMRQTLEKLEKKEKELQKAKQVLSSAGEEAGLEKQITLLSRVEPKLALQIMKGQMKEPDAVQLIMKMDENRVKAIVNACKTEDDKVWIGRILNQIGNYGSTAAAGMESPGAPPPSGG
jgi:hypothetical protein